MDKCFLALEMGSKHNEGIFSLSEFVIVTWYLSSKTGLDSKALRSKNSSFQIFARSFSDTLASIGRLGEEKNSVGTCDSPDNDDCVVLKDPSTMASAIPGVATDVPGTGTPLAGGGGAETSGTSDNALGLEVLLIEVVLVVLGGERRRVTSSATRATNWSNVPGEREMGCGSTEAVLDRVVDWSVLTTEDESWLAGFGCTAARLDFLRGGSPPAAIATARAEGLRRRFERFGGILSLQKNSEKKKKKNTRYYPKRYSYSENKKINRNPVMGKNQKKWQGKPVRQTVDAAASFLCQNKSRHKN